MDEIRGDLVRLATEELWFKMRDMQAGGMALRPEEWLETLARLGREVMRLRASGDTVPSSTNGSY